jgi:hypothetical protein
MQYAKSVLQVVATMASAAVVFLATGTAWTAANTLNVILAGVMAVGVLYVPNTANAPVAKMVVSLLSAVLALAATFVVGGFTTSEILQLVVAGLGALGVYGVRNDPAVNA